MNGTGNGLLWSDGGLMWGLYLNTYLYIYVSISLFIFLWKVIQFPFGEIYTVTLKFNLKTLSSLLF